MSQFLSKIWHDPVWSKVIATTIFLSASSLLIIIYSTLNSIELLGLIIFFILIIIVIFLLLDYLNIKKLKEHLGKKITLKELDSKFPNITKIGIVGKKNVGKTTFIENICRIKNTKEHTQSNGAYIFNLPNSSKYIAMLDGTGENPSIQNDLAIQAEILIILLDHNYNEKSTDISTIRLEKHTSFLVSLWNRLVSKNHNIRTIFVLMNKQDLWSTSQNKHKVKDFLQSEVQKIKKKVNNSIEIHHRPHSNSKEEDIKNLLLKIKTFI